MIDCMLVSDTGSEGPVVTILDKFVKDKDYILHFDIKIYGKETYEYFRKPRKLNSYILQLNTGYSIPLGIMCIVATNHAEYNWLLFDSTYNTLGVPGIAMPIGVLSSNIFD